MKKILLSIIALTALAANSFGQCAAGISATGVADDFSSATEFGGATGGFYYFAGAGGAGACSAFSAVASRTTNAGKLSVVLNNPYGCYVPFGYSFGTTATGAQQTIDISGNKTFTVDVQHPTTDTTANILFRLYIQDSLGRVLDTYAAAGPSGAGGGQCSNAWAYGISTQVPNTNAVTTLSGTFEGAYHTDYTNTHPAAAGTTSGGGCTLANNLDFTIVTQVLFMAINAGQNAADGYKPWASGNGSNPLVIIDNFRLGACPTSGVNDAAGNISSTKLYPNPVSDMANVELNLKSASNVKVTLTDMMGRPVMTIAEGSMTELKKDFSVANLNKGVYTVNNFVNGTAAKSEMLMVK